MQQLSSEEEESSINLLMVALTRHSDVVSAAAVVVVVVCRVTLPSIALFLSLALSHSLNFYLSAASNLFQFSI